MTSCDEGPLCTETHGQWLAGHSEEAFNHSMLTEGGVETMKLCIKSDPVY